MAETSPPFASNGAEYLVRGSWAANSIAATMLDGSDFWPFPAHRQPCLFPPTSAPSCSPIVTWYGVHESWRHFALPSTPPHPVWYIATNCINAVRLRRNKKRIGGPMTHRHRCPSRARRSDRRTRCTVDLLPPQKARLTRAGSSRQPRCAVRYRQPACHSWCSTSSVRPINSGLIAAGPSPRGMCVVSQTPRAGLRRPASSLRNARRCQPPGIRGAR